ncbi:phosphatase PAP2 family protein [Kribbella sp. NPDC048915]|uniref:phosphatase PAP2 family protein n=1 Tax=Kribbella sp. NPDC048915 TaxID=3155148 RepID=UPI0034059BB3
MAREVVLITAAIVLYFGVRGLMTSRVDVAFRNAGYVIDLERAFGVFVEPELQRAVIGHGWLVELLGYIYIYGHWPVLLSTLLWLLVWHREAYRLFRNAMLISGGVGLVIFASFPVAPPRFLTECGFADTVTERTSAYRVLQPPAFVNQYAAVPSLHFGWNLLMGIALVLLGGHWIIRLFGWVMPILMFAAIVLTANHFVFDGVAGGALALLGLYAATRISGGGMPGARSAGLARRRPRHSSRGRAAAVRFVSAPHRVVSIRRGAGCPASDRGP